MYKTGQIIPHKLSKTITESDNNLFCLLTMNHHPVHLNAEYAYMAKHGRILVVGTLVFSLVVGLTVEDVSFNAVANLGYDDVKHVNPVFIGDTIYAESTVLSFNGRVLEIETTGFTSDKVVITFKRKILYA